MIIYLESSLFDSPAQTLINTVNTVGVMGKGIAKQFKSQFPQMFKEYKALCDSGEIQIGRLHLWRGESRWVLNFPTKTTWRKPSEISYIEAGLSKFVDTYRRLGIASASFPPLGCGNGNLDWDDVRPLMERYLSKVSIPIYIHDVQVAEGFIPEHSEAGRAPAEFEDFMGDLRRAIEAAHGTFTTQTSKKYRARLVEGDIIEVIRDNNRVERIDNEMLEESWLRLHDRILSIDSFSDDRAKRLKSYLFPIVAELPYVRSVDVRWSDKSSSKSRAFFLDREALSGYDDANRVEEQGCLFQ